MLDKIKLLEWKERWELCTEKVAEKHVLNDLIVSWMCECVYDFIYFLRETGAWKAENWRANKYNYFGEYAWPTEVEDLQS